jgi:6-phosphogluconolactonase
MDTQISPDASDLARTVAEEVGRLVRAAVDSGGVAHVVLTGGTDGIAVTRELARLHDPLPWQDVHLWWGDERLVPRGHEDRNDAQAADALAAMEGLRDDHVHRMPAQGEDDPAGSYAAVLEGVLGEDPFDVLMLGIGPDGHVASLFPGRDLGETGPSVKKVTDSPKPPPERVTMTMGRLNNSRHALLFTSGEGKRDAMRGLLGADTSLPVSHVRAIESTRLFIDRAAQPETQK